MSAKAWPNMSKGNRECSQVKAAEEVGFMLENSTAGVGMPVKEQSAPRESSLAVG